jgi:hypothetical protein
MELIDDTHYDLDIPFLSEFQGIGLQTEKNLHDSIRIGDDDWRELILVDLAIRLFL